MFLECRFYLGPPILFAISSGFSISLFMSYGTSDFLSLSMFVFRFYSIMYLYRHAAHGEMRIIRIPDIDIGNPISACAVNNVEVYFSSN